MAIRLFLLATLLLAPIHEAFALERPTALGNLAVTVVANGINITVDPRIELILTLQVLSKYERIAPVLTTYTFPYKQAISYYFGNYDDHSAVNTVRRMSLNGFTYAAPLEVMLHLTSPPSLSPAVPLTAELIKKAGGNRSFLRFTTDLKRFSTDVSFMDYYTFNNELFLRIVTEVFYATQEADLVPPLEEYLGKHQNSYNFILAPLSFKGTYGISVGQPDSLNVYCIFGTRGLTLSEDPVFGDLNLFREEAWHTFGHAFVDAITARNRAAVNDHRALFDPVVKKLRKAGVTSWEGCVSEHIVRAIMIRLYATEVNAEEGEKRLSQARTDGFAYIDAVIDRLGEYEHDRLRYPALADFYPQFIEMFGELEKEKTRPVNEWRRR